ncbi:MAG: ferritin-like domain-containing protein [Chitinophagaceae bacterium]|nr:ferritin-like domain-containing protein [Chitinophagaceae bacterium]
MTTTNNNGHDSQLQSFFMTMLQEAYWSEQHLLNVLNTMMISATSKELRQAFAMHQQQTEKHVQRLEEAFGVLGAEPQAVPSVGMQGLFDDGWQVIDETEAGSANRDVALIIAAQKVEHFEMACYGSLVTLATTLGQKDIAKLLGKTLKEEKQTDAALTAIAESKINQKARKEQTVAE